MTMALDSQGNGCYNSQKGERAREEEAAAQPERPGRGGACPNGQRRARRAPLPQPGRA